MLQKKQCAHTIQWTSSRPFPARLLSEEQNTQRGRGQTQRVWQYACSAQLYWLTWTGEGQSRSALGKANSRALLSLHTHAHRKEHSTVQYKEVKSLL